MEIVVSREQYADLMRWRQGRKIDAQAATLACPSLTRHQRRQVAEALEAGEPIELNIEETWTW